MKTFLLSLLLSASLSSFGYMHVVKTVKVNLINPTAITYSLLDQAFYISNMNGENNRKNNSGFISRLHFANKKAINEVIIKGGDEGITLNAPKGIIFDQGFLYVADIDTVRIFKRGLLGWESHRNIKLYHASFLNRLIIDKQKNLWVSDTGSNNIIKLAPPYGTSQPEIYFDQEVNTPVGVAIDPKDADVMWVTSFSTSFVYKMSISENSLIKKYQTRAITLGGITFNDKNQIIATHHDEGKVVSFAITDKVVTRTPINKGKLKSPNGIYFESDSKLILVTDRITGELLIFSEEVEISK